MFESNIDLTEIRSVLTDAGHTVVGFATLALKKGNEVRLDTAKSFGSQIGDLRSQALAFIEKADETASELEERFDPIVTRMAERLPAPAASVALTLRQQGRVLRHKAHDVVVDALRTDAPVSPGKAPAVKVATEAVISTPKKAPAKKTVTAKTTAAKTTAAKKTVTKKAVSANKTARNTVKKAAPKKRVATASTR